MTALRDPIRITRSLAFSCQFRDIFTNLPITSALEVTVPSLRWRAYRSESEATYRFQATNGAVPTAAGVEVVITSPNGDYSSFEQMTVALPLPTATPPSRSAFLVTQVLWPTRLFKVPSGETAVVGRIVPAQPGFAVNGLRLVLHDAASAPVNAPYTYTDAQGEFLFRLPTLVARVLGTTLVTTATLGITATSAGNAVTVSPSQFSVTLGRAQFQQFTRS